MSSSTNTTRNSRQALKNIRVVMVRPKGSLNVGLVARVIRNMGLGRLVLVDPPDLNREQAFRMASRATDVLGAAIMAGSLGDALSDTAFSVGTSARNGGERGEPLLPRQAAEALLDRAASGPVALVLGPEDHGLSNQDLSLCSVRGYIPSIAGYSSLNITHAAALFCYECRMVALGRDGELDRSQAACGPKDSVCSAGENSEQEPCDDKSPLPAAPAVAPHGDLELFMARLGDLLGTVGFLNPQNPEAILRKLRRLLHRSHATAGEVSILLGIIRQIEWYIKTGACSRAVPGTGAEPEAQASVGPDDDPDQGLAGD